MLPRWRELVVCNLVEVEAGLLQGLPRSLLGGCLLGADRRRRTGMGAATRTGLGGHRLVVRGGGRSQGVGFEMAGGPPASSPPSARHARRLALSWSVRRCARPARQAPLALRGGGLAMSRRCGLDVRARTEWDGQDAAALRSIRPVHHGRMCSKKYHDQRQVPCHKCCAACTVWSSGCFTGA